MAVGSNNGEIALWELALQDRLVSKPFKIWDMAACSLPFQVLISFFLVFFILSNISFSTVPLVAV